MGIDLSLRQDCRQTESCIGNGYMKHGSVTGNWISLAIPLQSLEVLTLQMIDLSW